MRLSGFIGASFCTAEQKADIVALFGKIKLSNSLDYVSGWYYKAAEMMAVNPSIKASLVSTNSICQGEQVAPLWGTLRERFGLDNSCVHVISQLIQLAVKEQRIKPLSAETRRTRSYIPIWSDADVLSKHPV